MKEGCFLILMLFAGIKTYSWGFYAHRLINYNAVFLLPPEMLLLYKKNIAFLNDHAVDPDKRRYAMVEEGPRHYIDMDHYGPAPYAGLPRKWKDAVSTLTEDTLKAHGIVPWWIQVMLQRLTTAFREGNQVRILKLSAELGHYIADSHVPLHASSNHNGQQTNQRGIHGFWESRVPELLAEKEWNLVIGRASYIKNPLDFCWSRILESASEADSVLLTERKLSAGFAPDRKYAFETRSGRMVKQYSSEYSIAYNSLLDDMIERRLRQSIYAVASFWYTAWVNAGRPDLSKLAGKTLSAAEQLEFETMEQQWSREAILGRSCD